MELDLGIAKEDREAIAAGLSRLLADSYTFRRLACAAHADSRKVRLDASQHAGLKDIVNNRR